MIVSTGYVIMSPFPPRKRDLEATGPPLGGKSENTHALAHSHSTTTTTTTNNNNNNSY